jgi:hypothetical protein
MLLDSALTSGYGHRFGVPGPDLDGRHSESLDRLSICIGARLTGTAVRAAPLAAIGR